MATTPDYNNDEMLSLLQKPSTETPKDDETLTKPITTTSLAMSIPQIDTTSLTTWHQPGITDVPSPYLTTCANVQHRLP